MKTLLFVFLVCYICGSAFSEELKNKSGFGPLSAIWVSIGPVITKNSDFQGDNVSFAPDFRIDGELFRSLFVSLDYRHFSGPIDESTSSGFASIEPSQYLDSFSILAGPMLDFDFLDFGVQSGVRYTFGSVGGKLLSETTDNDTFDGSPITRKTYLNKSISKFEIPIRFSISLDLFKMASVGIDDSYVTDLRSIHQEIGFYVRVGYKW